MTMWIGVVYQVRRATLLDTPEWRNPGFSPVCGAELAKKHAESCVAAGVMTLLRRLQRAATWLVLQGCTPHR